MITTPQQRFILDNGDGSAVDRVFTFPVYDKSEVVVRRIDVDGILSAPLAEGVDYDIVLSDPPASGGPHPGGTITYHVAAIAGEKDYSYAQTPLKQNVKVTTTSTTYSLGLERNALDPFVFMVQELHDRVDRIGGIISPDYSLPEIPDPAGNNGKILYVDNDVYALTDLVDVSALGISGADAGRFALFTGTDSIAGLPDVWYVSPTKTTRFRGVATPGDSGVIEAYDSDDNLIAKIRADGDVADSTDLVVKGYADLIPLTAPLTGYTAGAGTVSAADTTKTAIQKIDGNLQALAPVTTLYRTATPVTVTHLTNPEHTIASYTVPGTKIGTTPRRLRVNARVKCTGVDSGGGSGNRSLTLKLKYGNTVLATWGADAMAAGEIVVISGELFGANSNTDQISDFLFQSYGGAHTSDGLVAGTAAETSTGPLAISLTAQWSAAHANNLAHLEFFGVDCDT